MAIEKVCGIETEYGVFHKGLGNDPNHIAASSLLINGYISEYVKRVGWDFEDESPGNDARGFSREGSASPEIETHLVNTVLTNGARYYVDHAHPEYSSPECRTPSEATLYDRAGEIVLQRSMTSANASLPPGQEIIVHKNNSDGKGNSYGCHENYLMDRSLPFTDIVKYVTPFFITRQIICGAGKVGAEVNVPSDVTVNYQISQRADFFEEEVGLETTLKRPIVNTRDEPHSDSQKYRRLHVIIGDANMNQMSTFIKLGATAIVLAMIEDEFLTDKELSVRNPIAALRRVSYDPELAYAFELQDGRTMTALNMQWEYFEKAKKYANDRGLDCVDASGGDSIVTEWERVLTALESDRDSLVDTVDWVAKYQMIEGYRDRHSLNWDSPKLRALDLQYHDMRPDKSLFDRTSPRELHSKQAAENAINEPPGDTRAYFRGKCLQKWPESIAAANWDSIVFDLGEDPLRRIPMMEPLKGTKEMVDKLLRECETPSQLFEKLGA